MKAQSPLITLRNLAQEAVEQAAQRLGQARQAQQAAEQQLTMLLNYQDEYRQKLNSTLSGGMEARAGRTTSSLLPPSNRPSNNSASSCCSGDKRWITP